VHRNAKQVVSHLKYEKRMLSEAATRFAGRTWKNHFEKCTLIEVVLLHARVLDDFLFGKTKNPKDVRAVQFFDNATQWRSNKAALCPSLSDRSNLDRLSRALAHISYDRLDESRRLRDRDISRIATEIQTAWDHFIGQLPKDRKEWFS